MELSKDICGFLEEKGIRCCVKRIGAFDVITAFLKNGKSHAVLPVEIKARNLPEAERHQQELIKTICTLTECQGSYPFIVTEDRWKTQNAMMKKRILSHLEIFFPVYARNCEVRRIDKSEAATFLNDNHSYGDAACRYRYGLFLKRHTGHIAEDGEASRYCPGTLIAIATFSNARKWIKGDKTIRSYEWTRYASLPELRVNGGMGKLLKAFIKDVQPDDIMSYADLEWSEGKVYEQLGFISEGCKTPVTFQIGPDMQRQPTSLPDRDSISLPAPDSTSMPAPTGILFYINLGSRKYRLKLTEYE